MLLKDKTAVVTGASRGIGRAVAVELAKNGANVVINYASNEAAARETLTAVEAVGGRGILVQADVADLQSCERLMKATLDNFGKIDILEIGRAHV